MDSELSNLSPAEQKELKARLEKMQQSEGFEEMIQDIPQFWGDYQLQKGDAEAFLALEGKGIEGGFDANSFFDCFHEETIDEGDKYVDKDGNEQTASSDIEGFEVNGTAKSIKNTFGLLYGEDMKFINVEGFFAWLRDKHSASENATSEE